MVDEDGGFDVVTGVESAVIDGPVYDLDIEHTHNFVAEGIVTHNSIYKFRGADFRNLMRFEEEFPDATVIVLEQNYRSSQHILDAANAVIANNAARRPKHLWTEQVGGELITRYHAEDEHDEAAFVVHEIDRLVDTEDHRFGDVAVFYRTNAQSRVIEESLVRAGVPYRVVGGVKFYDRREVKDVLAYLARAREPRRRSELEADRQHAPARRRRHVGAQGRRVRAGRGRHVPRRARVPRPSPGVNGKALGGIRDLLELMAGLEAEADRRRADDRGDPRAHRLPRRARGRSGRSRRRAGSRTCRSSSASPRVRRGARRRGDVSRCPASPASGDRAGPTPPTHRPRAASARIQAFLEAISLVTDIDAEDGRRATRRSRS